MPYHSMIEKMRHYIDVKLDVLGRDPPRSSICKVLVKIRKRNEDCYTPRIISIGPIHKENHDLQNMEDLKWTYAASFLHRPKGLGDKLPECIEAIAHLTSGARSCYSSNPNTLDLYDLAMIFLVNGCFILELFLRKASSGVGFLNVLFNKRGKALELPAFPLGEIENNIMRNFVAFEQCNFARTNHVIPYIKLLGSLIRHTEDIELLKKKRILRPFNFGGRIL
ncbi:hypothetical protein LguiB_031635 [Lonicera macranthoides]